MSDPTRKLKILLRDDLGNIETVESSAAYIHLLDAKPTRDFFVTCDLCEKIILISYLHTVQDSASEFPHMLCDNCYNGR